MKKPKHNPNKFLIVLTSLLYFPLSLLITILLTNQIKIFTQHPIIRYYIDLAVIVFITIALIESVYKFITGKKLGGIIYLFGGIKKADSIIESAETIKELEKKIKNKISKKEKQNMEKIQKWLKTNWTNMLTYFSAILTLILGILTIVGDFGMVWIVQDKNILPMIIMIIGTIITFIANQLKPLQGVEKQEEQKKLDLLFKEKKLAEKAKLNAEKLEAEKLAKAKALIEKEKQETERIAKEKAEEAEIKELAEKLKAEELAKEQEELNKNTPIM